MNLIEDEATVRFFDERGDATTHIVSLRSLHCGPLTHNT